VLLSDGNRADVTSLADWSSADPSQLSVAGGLVRAHRASGTVEISADWQGIRGQLIVQLSDAALQKLSLDPPIVSVPLGTNRQLKAFGTFSDGMQRDLTQDVVWISQDPAVADVSFGLVRGLSRGTSSVEASLSGLQAQAEVTVTDAVVVSVQLEPAMLDLPKGVIGDVLATAVFSDGTQMDVTQQAEWSSREPLIALASNAMGSKGKVAGVGLGMTVVEASFGGQVGEIQVSVRAATMVSLTVEPENEQLPIGLTRQFRATGTFTDNSTLDLTAQVTWSSSEPSAATISNADGSQGITTGVGLGSTTIEARLNGIEGETVLQVVAAVPVSLEVTPANVRVTVATSLSYRATALFSDASQREITNDVTWSISPSDLASITPEGRLTGLVPGLVNVIGRLAGVQGQTEATIRARTFRDRIWAAQYPFVAAEYGDDLRVFESTTMNLESTSPKLLLRADAFAAFDSRHNRVLMAAREGLNILDAETGDHVVGSPFYEGADRGFGTSMFPRTLDRRGFRAHGVAFDSVNNRVYLATTFGLYGFEADTMAMIAGSPFPAHAGDPEVTAVTYDATRDRIYMLSSEDRSLSGDNKVFVIWNAAPFSPIPGSPIVVTQSGGVNGQLALDEARGRLIAQDPNNLYTLNLANRSVSKHPRQGFTGGSVTNMGMLYVPGEDLLAVTDLNQSHLEIFQGSTLEPVAGSPVQFSGSPRAVTYDAHTRRFFVATSNGIEVVDARTRQRIDGSPFRSGEPGDEQRGYFTILAVP